ncbi:MAG TPA: Hsp70 family protein [Aggregatilineales bacterium]|nr:Hsp70 family protein [Anaerolineales bacterium]HRE48031.1 Hsp70 family protein [Aggregatilineales bacterium]
MPIYSIDFGTTNTVIARQTEDGGAEIVALPELSLPAASGLPPLIPSLVYITPDRLLSGAMVRSEGYDQQPTKRLFRDFKRGIVNPKTAQSRFIDGREWRDHEVGQAFLRRLIASLPTPIALIDPLVLTAPVAALEFYLAWVSQTLEREVGEKLHIVDESTAAALGYAVQMPEAFVLVVDFGGGTLDLSLVQLPAHREQTGGVLSRLRRGRGAETHTARVYAKAGRTLGGGDIDRWLLAEVCARLNVDPASLGEEYTPLLTACETAKIALATSEETRLTITLGGESRTLPLTRLEMRKVLEQHGFMDDLRSTVDRLLHVARREGIQKEDVAYVLLTGGTSLLPIVQSILRGIFPKADIRGDKPFTAVAEGALLAASGVALEDYLVNSYGLRHLHPETGTHAYDEIIPQGTRYPMPKAVEVILGVAHPEQDAVEIIVGLLNSESVGNLRVRYEDGQPVFLAQPDLTNSDQTAAIALNSAAPPILAALNPPGMVGKDRLRAAFWVDEGRRLFVTVTDMTSGTVLLRDREIATLR